MLFCQYCWIVLCIKLRIWQSCIRKLCAVIHTYKLCWTWALHVKCFIPCTLNWTNSFYLSILSLKFGRIWNARDSHSVFDALISQCWTYERMMRARMIFILMISSQMDRASDSFVGDYGKFSLQLSSWVCKAIWCLECWAELDVFFSCIKMYSLLFLDILHMDYHSDSFCNGRPLHICSKLEVYRGDFYCTVRILPQITCILYINVIRYVHGGSAFDQNLFLIFWTCLINRIHM